ncbi:transcriptional regulator [Paenibacillus sp. YPG26]|uniref:transcriptional regulator n=1 Tax=Paenibacillus sp. YPG26 TaxID=2878915 RepID=UPI00203B879C|nr:transcriptional regulator [Paenibacillus sp. YPG26]USB31939.1 transcriptional regulator [Paenibacillus sp. YPG26]
MTLNLKVAVIGPQDLVQTVMELGSKYEGLTMLPAAYQHEKDTLQLAAEVGTLADILLFTGPIPYQIALGLIKDKPMVHVTYSGTALYKVLFDFIRDEVLHLNESGLKISVDVLDREEIEERLTEIGITDYELYVKSYKVGIETEELVSFHHQLWREGKVKVTVTSVTSVYERLRQLGVPVYRVVPTLSSIRDTLNRALLEAKSLKFSSTQIAVGIMNIDNFMKVSKEVASEYELQRKKLVLQQILLDYGEETQALIKWTDGDEVSFITTRGIIEQTTKRFQEAPLLLEIMEKLQWKASIGIGIGRTANEAEGKAREALLKAKLSGGGNCFLIMQDGLVYGPMGSELILEYSVRSEDPQLLSIAKKVGLSVGTINKLQSFCNRLGTTTFTASQLAEGFGITLRSARRIMAVLEKFEIARIVGEEQPAGRGRPRQIYHITLEGAGHD